MQYMIGCFYFLLSVLTYISEMSVLLNVVLFPHVDLSFVFFLMTYLECRYQREGSLGVSA